MNIETMLHEEIVDEFGKLKDLEVGSDQHKTAVDEITKLMDRAIEMEKLATEREEKAEAKSYERKLKEAQAKEDKTDRLIKNIMTGVSIGLPAVLTVWGTLKSFEFEKEGTITTIMGRGFINKLLPKK